MVDSYPKPLADHPLISDWISFDDGNRVTIRSGRVELGQGALNAIAQMAAQELFVSRDQIVLLAGDTDLSPNEGYTVGSFSISEGGTSLRLAAAAARVVITQHVSDLLQCNSRDITIKLGQFYRAGMQTDLDFWNLPQFPKLDCEVLKHAQLAPISHDGLIGSSVPPNDLLGRLQGTAFIHDLDFPGLLHARMVLPPQPGLDFRIDESVADEIQSGGSTLVKRKSFVAVVNPREERAVAGADRLKQTSHARLTPFSHSDDMVDALDQLPTTQSVMYERCDSDESTVTTVSASVARPCISHASIGPSCAVAHYDKGQLTVWSHSQGVFHLRSALAGVLELGEKNIRVIHVPGAGCYGHNGADDVACDAAIVATAIPGSPIRMIYHREDEFRATTVGPAMRTEASARLNADGRIVSIDMSVTSPPHSTRPRSCEIPNLRSASLLSQTTGEESLPQYDYSDVPMPGGGAERNAIPGYSIPNVKVVKNSLTPPYRGSSLRSLGAYVNVLAIESLMDECAYHVGIDPVALRLTHLNDVRASRVVERVVEMADCDEAESGFGYAQYKNSAAYCACVAKVTVEEIVSVDKLWLAVDAGQAVNPDGVKAQIEGGAVQAISWLLCEEVRFGQGGISTRSWEDYPILSFDAVPNVTVEVIDSELPPLGCGEAAAGPAAAAVFNAVRTVLGTRPTRTPLTRDRLISAIEESD